MVAMYYSKKNGGFYSFAMKAAYETSPNGWPDDAIQISRDEYNRLLAGQRSGETITGGSNGLPVLTTPAINWQRIADRRCQDLLTEANNIIADWRTELQLGVISDDDKASLVVWMAYIKVLKTMNFSLVKDEADYTVIVWPELPAHVA